LDGCLEPLQNIGPDEIKIPQLLEKLSQAKPPFKEIILAFNPDMNGETTALYLKKILNNKPIKLSKLARGLPVGADLEYTDDITLAEALDNRQEIK
jgi:recombination protein RecR